MTAVPSTAPIPTTAPGADTPRFDAPPRTAIGDATLADMAAIIARYPQARSALLPMLHLVQSVDGFVTQAGIEICAQLLHLTTAEVAAVATFYTMYKRHPVGEYHVGVCTNTLCAVMGGDAVLARLEEHLGIGHDETTADGRISLEHIECNAACDYAPVVMVNWEFMDDQTPESALSMVEDLRAGQEVASTRGARICTFRQAERVLAGFNDGRTDEGPAAGPATLAGLRLARDNDWRAPGTADTGDDHTLAHRHGGDAGGDTRTAAGGGQPGATRVPGTAADHEGTLGQALHGAASWVSRHLPGAEGGTNTSHDERTPDGGAV